MYVTVSPDTATLGMKAGQLAAKIIKQTIELNGTANIILATGASQFETLSELIKDKNIDWGKVVMFHLDEYIGLPETSAASFRKYLKERFLNKVAAVKAAYLVNGEAHSPVEECKRLGTLITAYPIDLALVGIGENGHLAFNDPPADFDTDKPYIIVNLDESCRQQQFNEGWFSSINDVPKQAISMSVRQILKSKNIICSVPDARKAEAIKNCLELPVSNLYPAGILRDHPSCYMFLDGPAAKLLSQSPGNSFTA